MRRAMRRAARALVAAVALGGLGKPALVQAVPFFSSLWGSSARSSLPLAPAAARLEEMVVELAWLADDIAFPWTLQAKVQDGALEVSGAVPSEAVKNRALQIAKQATALLIKDDLQVKYSLPPRPIATPTAALRDKAGDLLSHALGQWTRALDIRVTDKGQVILHGRVGSMEDKLAVSRQLHLLPACCCVHNELQVMPVTAQGKSLMRVTRDGCLTVTMPSSPMENEKSVALSTSTTAAVQTTVAAQPKTPLLSPSSKADSATPNRSASLVSDVQPLPRLPAAPTLPGTPARLPASITRDQGLPVGSSQTGIRPVAWQASGSDSRVAQATPSVQDGTMPRLVPVPTSSASTPTIVETQPQPAKKGFFSRLWPFGRKKEETTVVPPAARSTTPTRGSTTSGTKTVTETPTITPATDRSAVPTGDGKPKAPYVANGVVIFEDDNPSTSPKPVTATPAQLKQRLVTLCGKKAHGIDVTTGPDKAMVVKLSVDTEAVEKELRAKILQMPEMQMPQTQLEIMISPK